jgi:hypothetical protein
MDNNRVATIVLNCRPNGRRRLGRPWRTLINEAETGLSKHNWWRMMILMIRKLNASSGSAMAELLIHWWQHILSFRIGLSESCRHIFWCL